MNLLQLENFDNSLYTVDIELSEFTTYTRHIIHISYALKTIQMKIINLIIQILGQQKSFPRDSKLHCHGYSRKLEQYRNLASTEAM